MKLKIALALAIAAVLLKACQDPYIPDPVDPRLSRYTGSGENSASAYYKEAGQLLSIWRSSNECLYDDPADPDGDCIQYISVVSKSGEADTLEIWMKGDRFNLRFVLLNQSAARIDDLEVLSEKTFELNGSQAYAEVINYYDPLLPEQYYPDLTFDRSSTGKLFIRKVSRNSGGSYVLNGTFGFDVPRKDAPMLSLHSGRFDYTVFRNQLLTRP